MLAAAEGSLTPGRGPSAITVVVFVDASPEHHLLGVRSVLDRTDADVVVGVLYPLHMAEFERLGTRVTVRTVGSISQLIDETYEQRRTHIAVLADPVVVPAGVFETALSWLRDDVRIGSVSLLSNAAEHVSFPIRNSPQWRPPDGHDETTVTRRLRTLAPAASRAPVVYAAGPLVILGSAALGAVGRFVAPPSARFDVAVADFSARARAKGFIDVADTSTFVWRPSDVATRPLNETLTHDDRGWLLHRHPSFIGFVDAETRATDSAFALAHTVARVKVQGLRIVVDGSCFGPNQVGTQVATEHTIRALAAHAEVASVEVMLPGAVPAYAEKVLSSEKVRALISADVRAIADAGDVADIAFRPYQPTPGWDAEAWRSAGHRLVISVLDTIAFHNGGYFESSAAWLAYREQLVGAVRAADAVTVISADVIDQMRVHGFPISDARLHAIPLGTEHLRADEPSRLPAELAARGFSGGVFALCLGVNYTHKNRELAMAAHDALRASGYELSLVFAGASVPYGTTRLAEMRHGPDETVIVLPEVGEHERNWLLRHAAFVWYPTSAEGFGLVPFEAAVFGTPTVCVDFGPLRELLRGAAPDGDLPLLAADWSAASLAELAGRFVDDPDLARCQSEAIRHAGARLTWTRTAESLVTLFREILAVPRR